MARETLISMYLDYANNYLTMERYAECNALTLDQANYLIMVARMVFNSQHPEA